jgi:membrane protein YqaA with SNARE-associated domain|tara:strand:- start:316 stop:900 length:585 start_codon:yes stop_codon:yes gene_type:complete
MRFLRFLYNWTLELANNPRAIWLLGFVSFIEAIFFPIPPDILLIPMILANIQKAWFYAFVATITSVMGGLVGYAVGFLAYSEIAEPLLISLGKQSAMILFSNSINENGFLIVLTAGISPIPFKVVSIMSGFTQMPLLVFLVSAMLGRATRFFVVATLLKYYGETIKSFIETYLGWLFLVFMVLIFVGTIGLEYL